MAARINCALTGRYVTLKAALGQYMNLAELQAFAYNSCPARTATGATVWALPEGGVISQRMSR